MYKRSIMIADDYRCEGFGCEQKALYQIVFNLTVDEIVMRRKIDNIILVWWAKKVALWYDPAGSIVALFACAMLITFASFIAIMMSLNWYTMTLYPWSFALVPMGLLGFALAYEFYCASSIHKLISYKKFLTLA